MSRRIYRGILLCALLAPCASFAAIDGDMAPSNKELAQAYWRGQEALKKSDWNDALERFRRLETDLRRSEPGTADAAIYWQAYALLKAKRNAEAKSALDRLLREFPDTRWKKDAAILMRQTQSAHGQGHATNDSGELADVAVEALMQAPPERALPILRKVLKSEHPLRVKKRALFVLSQIDEPVALDVLGEVASDESQPELRDEAIRMLGISGDARALDRLSALYASSKDSEFKSRIVQAWLIANRKDLVLDAARKETDASVRANAIRTLGAMQASKELHELFTTEKDAANRREIVMALGIAGDVTSLSSIAKTERDQGVLMEAIQAIGIAGGKNGSDALLEIHAAATSQEVRDASLHGLLISGNSEALRTLYQKAKTVEEKKSLLRMLSLLQDDQTLDLIEAELDSTRSKP